MTRRKAAAAGPGPPEALPFSLSFLSFQESLVLSVSVGKQKRRKTEDTQTACGEGSRYPGGEPCYQLLAL